ncbi:unnamed protein product [Paramecium primaurelia]|uniref:Uncharacterized protein n=1 Tax=Paramecium primaurelia TaxID=5886 RepID=A0A8S1QUF7_PARPR|nr:unnamed protein product [Paramecium primaurelia]
MASFIKPHFDQVAPLMKKYYFKEQEIYGNSSISIRQILKLTKSISQQRVQAYSHYGGSYRFKDQLKGLFLRESKTIQIIEQEKYDLEMILVNSIYFLISLKYLSNFDHLYRHKFRWRVII